MEGIRVLKHLFEMKESVGDTTLEAMDASSVASDACETCSVRPKARGSRTRLENSDSHRSTAQDASVCIQCTGDEGPAAGPTCSDVEGCEKRLVWAQRCSLRSKSKVAL